MMKMKKFTPAEFWICATVGALLRRGDRERKGTKLGGRMESINRDMTGTIKEGKAAQ